MRARPGRVPSLSAPALSCATGALRPPSLAHASRCPLSTRLAAMVATRDAGKPDAHALPLMQSHDEP